MKIDSSPELVPVVLLTLLVVTAVKGFYWDWGLECLALYREGRQLASSAHPEPDADWDTKLLTTRLDLANRQRDRLVTARARLDKGDLTSFFSQLAGEEGVTLVRLTRLTGEGASVHQDLVMSGPCANLTAFLYRLETSGLPLLLGEINIGGEETSMNIQLSFSP